MNGIMVYHASNVNNASNLLELAVCKASINNSPLTGKQKRTLGFIVNAAYRKIASLNAARAKTKPAPSLWSKLVGLL